MVFKLKITIVFTFNWFLGFASVSNRTLNGMKGVSASF